MPYVRKRETVSNPIYGIEHIMIRLRKKRSKREKNTFGPNLKKR